MNLTQMLQEIQVTLSSVNDKQVTCGEFHSALMGVIRRINAEAEKENELIMIARNPYDDILVAMLLDYAIQDDPDPEISFSDIIEELEFDSVNKCITLPATWTKLLAIYSSTGYKMRPVPYDVLRSQGYTDDYTSINRNIYFNVDVTSDTFAIVLKIRRDYSIPAINATEYTGMPENAYQLVLTGCILSLLQRPKYFNANLINVYAPMFDELQKKFSMLNITRSVHTPERLRFTYNPSIDMRNTSQDITF